MNSPSAGALAWLGLQPAGRESIASPQGTLQGLRLLAFLRVFAPLAQLLTLFVVTAQYEVQVPIGAVLWVLAIEGVVAVATWIRLRRSPRVTSLELFLQAHVDIALFATILYLTGGASNPFAPLFVLPMAVTASALPPRGVWATTVSTMLAYVFLRYNHVPLYHPSGETQVYELHENGMVVNYLFTAALLAFFVNRMHSTLRQHEHLLARARDAQMRNESVVAIGALAAGYAHELSTPLSTVAVVVAELQRERSTDLRLAQDLSVVSHRKNRHRHGMLRVFGPSRFGSCKKEWVQPEELHPCTSRGSLTASVRHYGPTRKMPQAPPPMPAAAPSRIR